jgi:hypothetical protein
MAASTLTTFDALLKERYIDSDKVEKLTYPDNVLLGLLEKKGDTGMVGDQLPVPVINALPQGISSGFSTAQTNATALAAQKWVITAGDYHGVVDIGDKVLKASRTNAGAFLDNKTAEIDGLYEQAGESLSIYTWGNGGQALGRRASAATNDITLVQSSDAQNFEIGMVVTASANDGSTSSDTQRTGSTSVTGVNRATGVVSLTLASSIASFSDQDFMFRQGDFFGDQGVIIIRGVQSFITATDAPPALWGITAATRATDPQRFAGCRVVNTDTFGKAYDERIMILLARMTGRYKAKMPTAGFMNPEDFQVLTTLMQTKNVRPAEDDNTKFGYMKIDVICPGGRIPIYNDRHCPKGTFFAFRMDDWWISSMGELLSPQNEDGFEMLRRDTSTNYQFRLISYPLLANRAPKNSGRVALSD